MMMTIIFCQERKKREIDETFFRATNR